MDPRWMRISALLMGLPLAAAGCCEDGEGCPAAPACDSSPYDTGSDDAGPSDTAPADTDPSDGDASQEAGVLLTGGEVELPPPRRTGGCPLMEALSARRSHRQISEARLPLQTLSDLLWATFGINRGDGKRTAPSAINMQEVDLYVASEGGVYLYEPEPHQLRQVLAEDVRTQTGPAVLVTAPPITLIYIADYDRMGGIVAEERDIYSWTDTGFISQNAYLFAASEGLATVVIGSINREALHQRLELRESQHIILSQPVGYPR